MLVYTFFARQFSCEFTHFLAYKFQGHKMRWSTIFFINIRYSKPGSVSPLPELRLNCKSKLMGEWNTLIDLLQQLYKIFPCCCHANSISESNQDLILTTHIVSRKIFRPPWPPVPLKQSMFLKVKHYNLSFMYLQGSVMTILSDFQIMMMFLVFSLNKIL